MTRLMLVLWLLVLVTTNLVGDERPSLTIATGEKDGATIVLREPWRRAVEKTAAEPPWKTLRVSPFPQFRRLSNTQHNCYAVQHPWTLIMTGTKAEGRSGC